MTSKSEAGDSGAVVASGQATATAAQPGIRTEELGAGVAAVDNRDRPIMGGAGISGVKMVGEIRQDGAGVGSPIAVSPVRNPTASGVAGPAPVPQPPQAKK